MKRIHLTILLFMFLTACEAPARGVGTAVPTDMNPASAPSATIPIALPPETIAAPTLAPNPIATSEVRLPPERWQEWPIVPTVTERAMAIYRSSQSMGLDGHAFSKDRADASQEADASVFRQDVFVIVGISLRRVKGGGQKT